MDRLLTQVRSRSLIFLSPTRSFSSFKPNSFDLKSRALLTLLNQTDTSKSQSSLPISNADLRYEHNPIFPLPGRVGFAGERKILSELNPNLFTKKSSRKNEKEFLSNNLEICTYDCSSSLRSELRNLFLNYNTLTQPLTAITFVFKTKSDMSTWSVEMEKERNELTEKFTKFAHKISTYLNAKQYWVDFIDPSNGKPYYGPATTDALFETDERCRYFGINIIDLGCCRVIEHLQYGTHVFVGYLFTSASKMDVNVRHLLDVSNYSK